MFTDTAVATIITLTMQAHGFYFACNTTTALEVILTLACGERIEAIRIIRKESGCGLKPALSAMRAVWAYMGKGDVVVA